jgi:hypothetical protein
VTRATVEAPAVEGARLGLLVEVLGGMPGLWERLIAQHTPDRTGKRCLACTTAGTGTPGAAWPCAIRGLAEAARRCHLAQRSGARR